MKRKIVLLLVLILLGWPGIPAFSGEADESAWATIRITDPSGRVFVEIRPEIELLAGVLSQTSWMERAGPSGSGNRYFRELKAFFTPYKAHEAVVLAEKLMKWGFTYDAPPNFILSLGPLPDMAPVNGYSRYLQRRAGGRRNLENFRQALVELAMESDFLRFYQAQKSYLEELLISSTAGFDGYKILAWLQDFFGAEGDEYHLVLAPAFFPAGGYGATIETKDGKVLVYQVIREFGRSEEVPEFGNVYNLESLSLHEWGHSFVNPALGKYNRQVKALKRLFVPVRKPMEQMAYGDVETFFNEQVLRAAVLLGTKDLYGESAYVHGLEEERELGFYLTDFTVEQLEYYRANRDKYPDFVQFVPYLLDQYKQHQEELLRLVEKAK